MMSVDLEEAERLAYFLLEELGHVEYRVRTPGEVGNRDRAQTFCTNHSAVRYYDIVANQYPDLAYVVERKHYSCSKWERIL